MMKPMGRTLLAFAMLVLSAAVLLTVPALAAGQSFSLQDISANLVGQSDTT